MNIANGGNASKQIKCPSCGEIFRVVDNDKIVNYCPYCGNSLNSNELSDQDLLDQIEKSGDL